VFEDLCLLLLAIEHRDLINHYIYIIYIKNLKLHGPSPRANYTDRATAACRRSDCQLVRIEGATWSALPVPSGRILYILYLVGRIQLVPPKDGDNPVSETF
jgi:hypothetical protein